MSFTSAEFLVFFLPLSLAAYYTIFPRSTRAGNFMLVAVSALFYSLCEPVYLLLLFVSVLFNWAMGLLVEQGTARVQRGKHCRSMYVGVAVNVALLAAFKLIAANSRSLRGLLPEDASYLLSLPVGLSFYTFNAISYLIDIGRKKASAAENPFDTALYLSFFVTVTSGPLVRYTEFEGQLKGRRVGFDSFSRGICRFVVGLGKKLLLANSLSPIAAKAFDGDITESAALLSWLGGLAYFFEVYLDFAGYSDMAIGLGAMFGFSIPENFRYPYLAKSVAEYWRRWHITLGAWFRSYVFYPASVSKVCMKINRLCRKRFGSKIGRLVSISLPLFAVWVLTGLWHSLSLRYLLWGLINGGFIIWETARRPMKNKGLESAFGHFYTVAVAFFTKLLVRAPSFSALSMLFKSMLGLYVGFSDSVSMLWLRENAPVLVVSLLLCFPVADKIKAELEKKQVKALSTVYDIVSSICTVILLLLCIAAIVRGGASPFIYGKF